MQGIAWVAEDTRDAGIGKIIWYGIGSRIYFSQQTQNICMTFVQRRSNVFDVSPTLYKCYTKVLCLLRYA